MPGRLEKEIKQTRPFGTVQEEVVLALMRTADQLAAPMAEVLRQAGLSLSQYNVLRILRGAGESRLPCGEITDRMVRREPDLTRLLDRLETRGLVERERSTSDRRSVLASITGEGRALLDRLEAPMLSALKRSLEHMPVRRLRELLEILEEARNAPATR